MIGWFKKFWYWALPGLFGGIGALWAIFRPKPKPPQAVPEMSDEERQHAHEGIESEKEEKIENRNNQTDAEVRDCLDRFRSD